MRSPTGRAVIRILAVLFALVGLKLSYELLKLHTDPPAAKVESSGLLNCSSLMENGNCEEAIKSHWGTLPGTNVPTSQLGIYYFTAMFWFFLLIGDVSYRRRGFHLLVTAIMAVALGFSIFLVYQIKVVLPHPCPLCLFSHAANAAMFVCMLLLWPRASQPAVSLPPVHTAAGIFEREPSPSSELDRDWPTGFAMMVLPIILIMSFILETPALFKPDAAQQIKADLHEKDAELEAKAKANTSQPATAEANPDYFTADQLCQRKISLRDDQILSMQSQIDTLQNALKGNTGAAELADLQKRLRSAEAMKGYWEDQYRRYDNRWQHTYSDWAINPPVVISSEGVPMRGPDSAQHVVTIYSDFQCPTCKKFEEWFSTRIIPLSQRYGGLKVRFKYWPICTKCNPSAGNDLHPMACEAAKVAQTAFLLRGNEGFWKMHDILFVTQDSWKNNGNFDAFIKQEGYDLNAFHQKMESPEVMAKIKADIEEGHTLGKELVARGQIAPEEQKFIIVDSTPSVFVDNKRFVSVQHTASWNMILGNPTPVWQPERRMTTRPAGAPRNQATTP